MKNTAPQDRFRAVKVRMPAQPCQVLLGQRLIVGLHAARLLVSIRLPAMMTEAPGSPGLTSPPPPSEHSPIHPGSFGKKLRFRWRPRPARHAARETR